LAKSTATFGAATAARRGLDLVDFFEIIAQFNGFRDGQARDFVADVFDFRTPFT